MDLHPGWAPAHRGSQLPAQEGQGACTPMEPTAAGPRGTGHWAGASCPQHKGATKDLTFQCDQVTFVKVPCVGGGLEPGRERQTETETDGGGGQGGREAGG